MSYYENHKKIGLLTRLIGKLWAVIGLALGAWVGRLCRADSWANAADLDD
jgi:hypothetical protein